MTEANTNIGRARIEYLESGVMVIYLGSSEEKFISLTADRLQSLKEALEQVRNARPPGVVIMATAADMFSVGADVKSISGISDPQVGENAARTGQTIFDLIQNLPIRSVAAISGPCVGGGCEMALACTYRIISDHKSSRIGLPEVKLGILPGFGGTQRLPRLVGLPTALDVILAGKTLYPKQARKIGLVDEIVSYENLLKKADEIAGGLHKPKRAKWTFLTKLMTNTSIGRSFVAKRARAGVQKQTKGHYPAPPAALDAVLYGLQYGQSKGLENEAKELGRLIVSPESKGLVNVYFLTEAAKSLGKQARDLVQHVRAVVVGAGVMGAGVASMFARNECSVILKDTNEGALEKARKQIKDQLDKIKHLSESERSFVMNRIETTSKNSANIGNANFGIEAIFEEMGIKQKVLSELAEQMPEDAIIATNTSSLSVSEIASAIKNPERVIGMHFFNPVDKMPLVEIIRGKQTVSKAIVLVAALANKLGKFPIVVEDVPGFLVNRILVPYLNEAAYLLQEGCSVKAIDRAALSFGMPMGPVRLLDEVGLDIATHVGETMLKGYGERMRAPDFAQKLSSKGRLGKKSGAGFYFYKDGQEAPADDLTSLLGITGSSELPVATIQDRLILSLVNEAVKCLDEGVAGIPGKEAAQQIDLGSVMGFGFPPFQGGLLAYAEKRGAKEINDRLLELAKLYGERFNPAPGITARAEQKKSFYS